MSKTSVRYWKWNWYNLLAFDKLYVHEGDVWVEEGQLLAGPRDHERGTDICQAEEATLGGIRVHWMLC